MRNAREMLSHFTASSLTLTVILALGYIITLAFPQTKTFLILVPGKVFFAVWTCLTSSFVVVNPVELLIDITAVVFIWKIVEPVYGAVELIKLLTLVALATGITTFAVAYTTFVIGRSVSALYVKICGFHGLLGTMFVCFKQVAPDHQLLFCDAFRIKAQWLPSLYVFGGMFLGLLYHPLNFYPFLLFGTYYSWFYLRFFQIDKNTKLKGDPSPSFSFASFFPDFMQSNINKIAAFCSSVFQLEINRRNETGTLPVSVRNGDDDEKDLFDQTRRRERGQRALDARLGAGNGDRNIEIPQISTQDGSSAS